MRYPNIDAECARAGLNGDALAKELGVSKKTVYNWKANGNFPQKALEKMADLFCCSIDYLLDRSSRREVRK